MTDRRPGADEETVLVVDDEELFLELYREWLGETYAVEIAREGDAALDRLDDSVVAALVDRRMSGRNGDATLAAIRERSASLPVALVTAVEPDPGITGLAFDEYVVKPTDRTEVVGLVERLRELDGVDGPAREYYRLHRTRDVLRSYVPDDELDAAPAYESLVDRIETVSTQLDGSEPRLPEGVPRPH
jgi:DNA-binding response OmpR family regulator